MDDRFQNSLNVCFTQYRSRSMPRIAPSSESYVPQYPRPLQDDHLTGPLIFAPLSGPVQRRSDGNIRPSLSPPTTPNDPNGAAGRHFYQVSTIAKNLSFSKIKDVTSSLLSRRANEITFTVPPTVSPISPRRGIGDLGLLSPLSPRRAGLEELLPLQCSGGDFGGESKTTTPSPALSKSYSPSDLSGTVGASSLGAINPDLYNLEDLEDDLESFPEEHIGRVWFQLDYEAESEKLKVTLLRAKNLSCRTSGTFSCCDSFVRLHLMPDERRYLQTKVKNKTRNPRFEEAFVFQDFTPDENKKVQKMDLRKETAISPLEWGELQVSLCFNDNHERLTVTVGASRNIKVVKTKKTEVVRTDRCPAFNESFIFKVTEEQLDTCAISISLNANRKSDPVLGRVLLGPYMFARGKAKDLWDAMLARRREYSQMWLSIS